jgi:UMP-CMP kinase 2
MPGVICKYSYSILIQLSFNYRFCHSTIAYGIANETSFSDMPPIEHHVYQWPSDLLKPNLVLFLTVTEQVRKKRLSNREWENTFEEQHLDKDKEFRKR